MAKQTYIFDNLQPASWTVPGKARIAFSVRRLVHSGGNRLKPHERYLRDGAKHDDTGCEATAYEITIPIFNGNNEDGVDRDAYPDKANELEESFAVHDVGDLVIPTKGKRRCRLDRWNRVEDRTSEGVDVAVIVAKWTEDNEDDAGQAAFQAPSASSAARRQAEEFSDAMEDSGQSLGDTVDDVNQAADDVQAMANAPAEFASDLETQANSVMHSAEEVEETVTSAGAKYGEELANLFTDPGATVPGRALRRLEDTVRKTVLDKFPPPFSRIAERRYPRVVSIFAVASEVGQDVAQLMAINAGLPDLKAIAANTAIKVYA